MDNGWTRTGLLASLSRLTLWSGLGWLCGLGRLGRLLLGLLLRLSLLGLLLLRLLRLRQGQHRYAGAERKAYGCKPDGPPHARETSCE